MCKQKIPYLIILTILLLSCSENFTPKPKGYNYIELPEHIYKNYKDDSYPYQFDLSAEATIFDDTIGIVGDGWKIISYPNLNASIYITYEPIKNKTESYNLIEDSYRIAYKHDVKAYSIDRRLITTKIGLQAVIFQLEGEVPSPFQFFMHDKDTTNYFRGAVYLPTAVKNDSLAPIIDYVSDDMLHLLESFEWRK